MTASPRRPGQRQMRLNSKLFAMLVSELMDGPCTALELADVTGLNPRTVAAYLTALREKNCLRIAAWERDSHNRQSIRVYELGRDKDAKKAPPLPRAGERKRLILVERLAA